MWLSDEALATARSCGEVRTTRQASETHKEHSQLQLLSGVAWNLEPLVLCRQTHSTKGLLRDHSFKEGWSPPCLPKWRQTQEEDK